MPVEQPSLSQDTRDANRPTTTEVQDRTEGQQKPKVLFVDDEPEVLNSLRRMFRKHRNRWDVQFANSGPEAIKAMQKEHFDVLFTDMRMPGLDGAAVLKYAAEESPASVRYVLSGHADQNCIDKAAHLIHQYLHKPASLDQLENAIESGVKNSVGESSTTKVREFVNGLSSVPSRPEVYTELMKCSESEHCSMHDITDIVQSDPAVSAKVLQLVNSSFYGLATKVSSIPTAIRYLGMENLKRLALAASVFRTAKFKHIESNQFVENLWEHSMECAELAADFANAAKVKNSSEAFTAGLLHDLGKLLLLEADEERYLKILLEHDGTEEELLQEELATFGFNHAHLGAHILQLWGLPEEIVNAVQHHHEVLEFDEELTMLHVVNAANAQLAIQQGKISGLPPLLVEIQSRMLGGQ